MSITGIAMKKFHIIKICTFIILFFTVIMLCISCRKDHNKTTNTSSKLVQSVWSKNHKLDSSGRFYTGIDSFMYDSQNRIVKTTSISFDTIFTMGPGGSVLVGPMITHATTIINYTGSNSLPDNFTESVITNGHTLEPRTFYLYFNNSGQLIKDSLPGIITHFTYSPGLITLLTNFGNMQSYSNDTMYVDADNNVKTNIFGGNFFLDSNNNAVYGKYFYYTDTYSNVLNPLYAITSLSIVSLAQNNNITTKLMPLTVEGESYRPGQNGIITTKETRQYQYTVGADNFLQSSFDIINGDTQKWYYY
jgi:hypothetical protein